MFINFAGDMDSEIQGTPAHDTQLCGAVGTHREGMPSRGTQTGWRGGSV